MRRSKNENGREKLLDRGLQKKLSREDSQWRLRNRSNLRNKQEQRNNRRKGKGKVLQNSDTMVWTLQEDQMTLKSFPKNRNHTSLAPSHLLVKELQPRKTGSKEGSPSAEGRLLNLVTEEMKP